MITTVIFVWKILYTTLQVIVTLGGTVYFISKALLKYSDWVRARPNVVTFLQHTGLVAKEIAAG